MRTVRWFITSAIAGLLAVCMVVLPVAAEDVLTELEIETVLTGACGDGLTWTFDKSERTLTISGDGMLFDYEQGEAPWWNYRSQIKEIFFAEDVSWSGERNDAFLGVAAEAFYPASNSAWTAAVRQSFGGDLTWIPYGEAADGAEPEVAISGADAAGIVLTAPAEGWKKGSNTFLVSCEKPCVAAVSQDGGSSYDRLQPVEEDGGYRFTAENVNDETILGVILLGDTNGDGQITNADVTRLAAAYSGKGNVSALELLAADVNQSGDITNADITKLSAVYAEKTRLNW